ncbi:MAG TPA: hypothetical protein VJZ91_11970 [Blastocatellia bacterium]|nr:hypothetical protein [Blastocatellia bacterium]
MAGFSLKQNQDTYNFDLAGAVTLNGNAVGKWATNQTNQIVVTKDGGGTVAFDVGWAFNADNHLVLSSGGAALLDFNAVAGLQPFYATRDAVLVVRPDEGQLFSFELRGDWKVSNDHLLSITLNGVESIIDGFFFDPRSRFMYHFADKKNLLLASVLGFVGTWESFVDASGNPRVRFQYQMEPGADGKPRTGTFELPAAVIIDRSSNQLVYQYDKGNQTRQIQFVGTLAVSPDFVITYALDRQTSGTGEQQVGSTTFSFGAVINKKNFTGDLQLIVKKPDGSAGGTTLAIRGSFRGVRGSTSLQVGFTFEQTRGADKITTTFGFAGVLQMKNGSIQWAFTSNSVTKTINLAVNADIRFGKVNVDPALNLTLQNGQVVGVKFLLGVSF